jgi:hypothetical protein
MFFTYGGFGVHPTHYSTRQILKEQNFIVVSSAEFLGAHTFNLGGWRTDSNFATSETHLPLLDRTAPVALFSNFW